MKVRLKRKRSDYYDLTLGNLYEVIGIEADDYRIMNDLGRPYLYPSADFSVVDATRPRQWKRQVGTEGEEYCYPPQLARPGFFEDIFEGNRRAMATLHEYLTQLHPKRRRPA